jgi:hypothetical protein
MRSPTAQSGGALPETARPKEATKRVVKGNSGRDKSGAWKLHEDPRVRPAFVLQYGIRDERSEGLKISLAI